MFDVDVEVVPLPQLEEELCAWAGRLAAGTCVWLLGLAAFDRRKGWCGVGIRSCAHWLSWRCGLGLRAGYEHLRVAHALERFPVLREAFAAGRLSYSKVRAIARVAQPETEAEWVRQAGLCTAGQLERLASVYAGLSLPGRAQAQRRRSGRRCAWHWDDEGNLVLHAVLPAELGAIVVQALEAAAASLHDSTPPEDPIPPGQPTQPTQTTSRSGRRATGGPAGTADAGDTDPGQTDEGRADDGRDGLPAGRPPAQGRTDGGGWAVRPRDRADDADALVALAEGFLTAGAPALADPGRYTVNVHINADLLTAAPGTDRPKTHKPGPPQLPPPAGLRCDVDPGGIGLSPQTVRRLACDTTLRTLIVDNQGSPLDLGRRRRTPTDRLRAAVHTRDRGVCQYPGCDHTRWLHIHHLEHWADDGDTALPNLITLCTLHHTAVHEEGITLHRDDQGVLTARHPGGWTLHPAPPLHPGNQPTSRLDQATRHISPTAIIPDWAGDPLHLTDSIHALVSKLPNQEVKPTAAAAEAA